VLRGILFKAVFCALVFCVPVSINAQDIMQGRMKLLDEDYDAAMSEFLPLAEAGNTEAMYHLGRTFSSGGKYFGLNFEQGRKIAGEWYQKAFQLIKPRADKGDLIALYELRRLPSSIIPHDLKPACKEMEPLAQQGDVDVQWFMAEGSCEDGATYQWTKEAIKTSENLAKNGSVYWQLKLALFYYAAATRPDERYRNMVLGREPQAAGSWDIAYENSCSLFRQAAENGSRYAQYRVYSDCSNGGEERVYWLRKSADQGLGIAQFILAHAYEKNLLGIVKSNSKAFEWYKKAAENGMDGAPRIVADWYYRGIGVDRNYAEAFRWYQKSAHFGNDASMEMVIHMYEKGIGVDKDEIKAFDYYRLLLDEYERDPVKKAHRRMAAYKLGHYYRCGIGGEKDYVMAEKYLAFARDEEAVRRYPHYVSYALYELSQLYREGLGVEQNIAEANALLKTADALYSGLYDEDKRPIGAGERTCP